MWHSRREVLKQSSELVLGNSKKLRYLTRIGRENTRLLGILHHEAWNLFDSVTSQQYRALPPSNLTGNTGLICVNIAF